MIGKQTNYQQSQATTAEPRLEQSSAMHLMGKRTLSSLAYCLPRRRWVPTPIAMSLAVVQIIGPWHQRNWLQAAGNLSPHH